mmetsp:Transcript_17166/g.34381  ORF Transcript_17166/g.34381 Transcript_17166/m.34381 type:complete len:534 (-) Transcript_17166:365-1966(-)
MGKRRIIKKKVEVESSSSEEEVKKVLDDQQYASSSDDDDSDDDSSSGEEVDGDLRALGYGKEEEKVGSSDEDDAVSSSEDEAVGDDEEVSDDDDDGQEEDEKQIYTGEEGCTLDLRNLTAVNSHQVNTQTLYKQPKASSKKKKKKIADDVDGKMLATIPPPESAPKVNEEQLLETARQGCTQILKGLWSLETERTDVGPMGILPQQFQIKTPRELVSYIIYINVMCQEKAPYVVMYWSSLNIISPSSHTANPPYHAMPYTIPCYHQMQPPPPPKKESKWEKFAKERGIPTNKEKRSRKVWDEATGTWMYRHGYQKANDNTNMEWPIMEVKGNEDPYDDPWERAREAKRSRVDKNTENRMRNMERAGLLAKGTTTRTFKDKAKARVSGKATGGGLLPSGIPLDMVDKKQRGKDLTKAALIATQRSTASLGKFDMMREGEPERKKAMAGLKKRKFESATDRKVVKTEADRNSKVLDTVLKGGGVQKQKAIRRGEFAKGVTAYDYEFNDGGDYGYKKKKGRAGAGKMRKVTKKRAK